MSITTPKTTIPMAKLIAAVLTAGLLLAAVSGCNLFAGLSKVARAEAFVDDLDSGNYATLRNSHIHPDTSTYDQLDEGYWETNFPEGDYSLSDTSSSDNLVSGVFTGGDYNNASVEFTMKEYDGDQMIKELVIGNDTIVPKP